MSENDDRLRALLKLPEGVVLSDEERVQAVAKAPAGERAKLRDEVANNTPSPRQPRKFGGMR